MKKFRIEKAVLMIGIGICMAFFIASIILSVKHNSVGFFLDGIPFLCYSSFMMLILSKNNELKKHMMGGGALGLILMNMSHDLKRYEKLYGKLPEEEKKEEEPNEEQKEE